MEKTVIFELEGGIATITLNRPEKRNAMNQQLLVELYDAIERASSEGEVQVAILTGSGKAFCSGMDLDAIRTENLLDPRGDGKDLPDVFGTCRKPIIGAINGAAITGGFELALNCDFLIASEQAFFADTHIRLGIHPAWGMTQLLPQAVGQRMARQISFTGQPISAGQALGWGLVNEVVPAEGLLLRAKEIAADICAVNQEMLAVFRGLINQGTRATLAEAFDMERKGAKAFALKHLKKG